MLAYPSPEPLMVYACCQLLKVGLTLKLQQHFRCHHNIINSINRIRRLLMRCRSHNQRTILASRKALLRLASSRHAEETASHTRQV